MAVITRGPQDLQSVTDIGASTTTPSTFESTVGTTPALTVKGPSTGSAKIQSWQFAGVEEAYVGQLSFFPGILAPNLFFFGLTSAAQFLLMNSLGNGTLTGIMEHSSSFGSINFVTEASNTRLVKGLDCDGQDIITDADADSRWENGTDDEVTYVASGTNALAINATHTWQQLGQKWARRAVTNTNTTIALTDYYVSVSTSTTAVTITFPTGATVGTAFRIKDRAGNAAANNITVTPPSGHTIDTGATYVMNQKFQSALFIYDGGTNWEVN